MRLVVIPFDLSSRRVFLSTLFRPISLTITLISAGSVTDLLGWFSTIVSLVVSKKVVTDSEIPDSTTVSDKGVHCGADGGQVTTPFAVDSIEGVSVTTTISGDGGTTSTVSNPVTEVFSTAEDLTVKRIGRIF